MYEPMKRIYDNLAQRIGRTRMGGHVSAVAWNVRQRLRTDNWAERSLASADHPHRRLMMAAVAEVDGLHKLLEVGCGSGPNLVNIAQQWPGAEITGIDINKSAIEYGRRHIKREKITNVRLAVGSVYELTAWPADAFDVVLVDAVLMFIPAARIDEVLVQLNRITKRRLILNEYVKIQGESRCIGRRWIHDAERIIRRISPNARITYRPCGFEEGLWDRYGSLVTIDL